MNTARLIKCAQIEDLLINSKQNKDCQTTLADYAQAPATSSSLGATCVDLFMEHVVVRDVQDA